FAPSHSLRMGDFFRKDVKLLSVSSAFAGIAENRPTPPMAMANTKRAIFSYYPSNINFSYTL
ncbi:hypothetical protein, partial [Heyndrickxia coagulans]